MRGLPRCAPLFLASLNQVDKNASYPVAH
jgi:hypothetical protein